jgi:rSAM/selenodomain-associated transferase 2
MIEYSIIIPVYHEVESINNQICHVHDIAGDRSVEIIVVDGNPAGDTIHAIEDPGINTIISDPGRARQMNAGAAAAGGDILLFLHVDTRLPERALETIDAAFQSDDIVGGAFDLEIDSPHPWLKFVSYTARLRTRITRIPYGDQAIFFKRAVFHDLGGYADIPIMEDVDIMRRIREKGWNIALIPDRVKTSSRRYVKEGMLYTTLRNHYIRILYGFGVPPEKLVKLYNNHKEK